MRKESSNKFTEGLICDLNPINTPNTVLTDALNATLITYDGNEHSLQNDRGNYQLKNCRLKPNYIPVGLKEYGDILYIVSYNPLDNNVEIGTYPSPLNVESSNEESTPAEVDSVIETINGFSNYTDLIKKAKLHIYTGEGDEEQFKIYPGDEYCLNTGNGSDYKYEDLEYFIIDENRKRHNVSDLIIVDNQYHNVAWQVPGWLATQYRVGNFEDFNMSVRSFTVPVISKEKNISCKASLHFQFKITDKLFLPVSIEKENEIKSDIYIRLTVKANDITKEHIDIPLTTDGKFVEWFLDSKILWTKYDTVIENIDKQSNIVITAMPVVKIATDGVERNIIYDNLLETTSFNVNSIGSIDDFKIATDLWKFYTDFDSNAVQLEYNVSGPNVTNSIVNLFYRIRPIEHPNGWSDWKMLEGYSGIGDQINSWIPFDDFVEKEAIYVIEFAFASDKNNIVGPSGSKLIITSEIFGNFVGEKQNFDEITFDEWAIDHYGDSLNVGTIVIDSEFKMNNKKTTCDHSWNISKFLTKDGKLVFDDNDVLRNLWKNEYVSEKGWIKSTESNKYTKSNIVTFKKEFDVSTSIKTLGSKVLSGKLWNNVGSVSISAGNLKKTIERSKLIGIKNLADFNVTTQKSRTKNYNTIVQSEIFRTIASVKQEHEIPMLWLHATYGNTNLNDRITFTLKNCGNLVLDSDFNIPEKWNYKTSQISSETLYESNPGLGGTIATSILNALGNKQFGVLGLYFTDLTKNSYKTKLKHSGTDVITLKNGDTPRLFTYLVFRTNKNVKYATMVPISDNNKLWNYIVGCTNGGSWDPSKLNDAGVATQEIIKVVANFAKGLKIVSNDKAIDDYRVVKINLDNNSKQSESAPFNINVISNKITTWMYSDKYDLLLEADRVALLEQAGLDSNLLKSLSTNIPEKIIKTEDVVDKNSADGISLEEFEETVVKINDMVINPETASNMDILSTVESSSDTRGVYSGSNLYPSLIDALNQSYRFESNTDYLTLSRAGYGDLNIYLTDDENTMTIGKVTSSIKIG